jgi:hypothetical protein
MLNPWVEEQKALAASAAGRASARGIVKKSLEAGQILSHWVEQYLISGAPVEWIWEDLAAIGVPPGVIAQAVRHLAQSVPQHGLSDAALQRIFEHYRTMSASIAEAGEQLHQYVRSNQARMDYQTWESRQEDRRTWQLKNDQIPDPILRVYPGLFK